MIHPQDDEFDTNDVGEGDFGGEDFDDQPDDGDTDDAELTIACPYCQNDIYEDAPQCPHCGNFLSDEESARPPRPAWLIAGVVLGLLVILSWIAL